MSAHYRESHRIVVRREAQALLNGGFSIHQALALVQLREAWKPRLAVECRGSLSPSSALKFARWLFAHRVLRS